MRCDFSASWLARLPLAVISALIAHSADARGTARIGYAAWTWVLRDASAVVAPIFRRVVRSVGIGHRAASIRAGLEPLALGQIRAATYICYGSAFPRVARSLVSSGANLLVNISNNAWFGSGVGAEQHFQMGRVRAIETRRYLARAGNDGGTAVIDSNGRVAKRLPRFAPGVLRGSVALLEDLTPFVRFGDWIVWLCAAAVALCVGLNVKPRVLL